MNMSPRVGILLVITLIVASAPLGDAAAQCELCPTTPVVAYQPVATQVVTPVAPGLINGWYPGKLLDRWAASRAAYRATALTTATTAYRPVATAVPVTSYRPVTSLFSTSYLPVSVYRPVYAQTVVPTTAYSPIVTSSAVCCDPCSTGSVISSYPSTTSACCGVPTATTYGGVPTPQPELGADVAVPEASYYRSRQSTNGNQSTQNANGASGAGNAASSVLKDGEENGSSNDGQQNGDTTSGARFEAPPLHVPGLPDSDGALERTARVDRTDAIAAIYAAPVRPQLVRDSRRTSSASAAASKALPSRAERDAGWTAVSN